MRELPDDNRTPYVTVVGIGELGVRVLLKLHENQREGLNLCAIVSDETRLPRGEKQITRICVEDVDAVARLSELRDVMQDRAVLVVAAMAEAFSAKALSGITLYAAEQNLAFLAALLIAPDGSEGQSDHIHQTKAIYMTPEVLRRQCRLQPELFDDDADVVAETALGIADMRFHNLIGFDVIDIRESLSRPGKMTAVFGQGNTAKDAVDDLLPVAKKIGIDLRRCELALFSMSGASNRLAIFEVHEALRLMAEKTDRDADSLSGDSFTLLSAPPDDSLGDKLKIFAVLCER